MVSRSIIYKRLCANFAPDNILYMMLTNIGHIVSRTSPTTDTEVKLPETLRQEIDALYKDMVNQYFTTRARKYLAVSHREDFITGIWRSIRQLQKENITKEMIDEGQDSRAVDTSVDIISVNVLFFLTDFNGEEQAIAETQYHQFIKDRL